MTITINTLYFGIPKPRSLINKKTTAKVIFDLGVGINVPRAQHLRTLMHYLRKRQGLDVKEGVIPAGVWEQSHRIIKPQYVNKGRVRGIRFDNPQGIYQIFTCRNETILDENHVLVQVDIGTASGWEMHDITKQNSQLLEEWDPNEF